MDTINLPNVLQKSELLGSKVGGRSSVENSNLQSEKKAVSNGQLLPEKSPDSTALSEQTVDEKISDLNSFIQTIQRGIQFSVHEETGNSVITVTDKETGDIIRTFPSEQMLAIASQLSETLTSPEDSVRGLLVSESA